VIAKTTKTLGVLSWREHLLYPGFIQEIDTQQVNDAAEGINASLSCAVIAPSWFRTATCMYKISQFHHNERSEVWCI